MPSSFKVSASKVFKCILLVSCGLALSFQNPGSFKETQMKYKRVKSAYDKKWAGLQAQLREKKVDPDNFQVLLNCYKMEKVLEVWCRSKGQNQYTLVKAIPICASSGVLGPKRTEGDGQVPEGFYEIAWFNPMSDYHLGLKINYPNASDRIKAKGRPGGDIMIHGSCVTIGCIPLQNDPIEELYVLCVESRNHQKTLPVNIYPFYMNKQNIQSLLPKFSEEQWKFWNTLKEAYDFFDSNRYMPKVSVTTAGDYKIGS